MATAAAAQEQRQQLQRWRLLNLVYVRGYVTSSVLRAAQVVLHLELVDLTVCIRRIVCFK